MSPAPVQHHADHAAAAGPLAATVQVLEPAPPAQADETAGDARRGRAEALQAKLPQGLFEFAARCSAKPSKPARSLVPAELLTRSRHRGVPVTWIDRAAAARGVIIHLHGGSFAYGEKPDHWNWLNDLRLRTGAAVAMVHYRLAPQLPFPAAYDDAIEAVRGILEDLEPMDMPWVLSGDSAGGGLALAVAQALHAKHEREPRGIVLTSPWVDLTGADAMLRQQAARDEASSLELLQRCTALYADGRNREDPRLSPLFGEMTGLPPVHLVTGTDDLLYGDAVRLREALSEAVVPLSYLAQPGGTHLFPLTWRGLVSQHARRAQITFVRECLGLQAAVGLAAGIDAAFDGAAGH